MRILITGAGGMLGSDLRKHLTAGNEIVATGLESGLARMDITDRDRVVEVVVNYAPDLIIHCAALTDVELCERDPEQSDLVNRWGTAIVVTAARAVLAPVVFLSTDFVFDGMKGAPYNESDTPNPLNVYGRDKLRAETIIRKSLPEHYIVRTAWLFGAQGRSFPKAVLDQARAGLPVRAVTDQVGSPTCSKDLAKAIAQMVTLRPEFGTYHLVNEGEASRFEVAQETLRGAGLNAQVEGIHTTDYPSAVARPTYSALDTAKAGALGIRLRHWKDAIAEFAAR